MQTPSSTQFSLDDINMYTGMPLNALAEQNADSVNRNWQDTSKAIWKLASQEWQDFRNKWHGSIVDSESTSLSLEPLPLYLISVFPSIVIRKSYVKMFDRIWFQVMVYKGQKGIIVTGQPGTGKSVFQYYLLVRLLRSKQVVLFSMDDDAFLFYHDKVYTTSKAVLHAAHHDIQLPKPASSSVGVFIWSLFEIQGQHEPEMLLVRQPCLPVQTTPLDLSCYKTWYKERMPLLTGLPLWTRDELLQGLRYQEQFSSLMDALCAVFSVDWQANPLRNHWPSVDPLFAFPGAREVIEECKVAGKASSSEDALECLLDAAIVRFGYSARDVFNAVFNFSTTTLNHEEAFAISFEHLINTVRFIPNHAGLAYNMYHNILAVSPVDHGPLTRVGWSVDFKSEWVARNMIRQLDATERGKLREQIHLLQRIPHAISLARQLESIISEDTENYCKVE